MNALRYRPQLRTVTFGTLAALLVAGCGKNNNPESELSRKDATSSSPGAQPADWAPHPDVPDGLRAYEWNRQQMDFHFKRAMLTNLPDYVENLRGWGGEGYSESEYATWGGVVPSDRIADFRDFIRGLGVPEEWMNKSSGWLGGRRDSDEWVAPDPPATRLVLCQTIVAKGSGSQLGLSFVADETMGFIFDNPNLSNSRITLKFSSKTGNFTIREYLLDI